MLAVALLELHEASLRPADLSLLEGFLRESRTWALVDGLAASVVGPLVERSPETGPVLDRWAADRRLLDPPLSSPRAAFPASRRGAGDFGRFCRYADLMLGEQEFFIRKAIGWVLREPPRSTPRCVFDWLRPRAHQASGITLHEAVKPMSAEQRAAILAAR